MKKLAVLLLLLVLAATGLPAGCGPAVETTTAETSTSGPTATVSSGGTLRLAGVDPYTLDPGLAAEMTSHTFITQIFGGLVKFDGELNVVPDIAEGWEISPDGTVYTFRLRQGVTFHDGGGVTAGDFLYSWERACRPVTGSSVAATYLGDIIGVHDMLAGRAQTISGVKVINDYTLQVTIDKPRSYFLYKLTYPTAFVVDQRQASGGSTWWRQPNGTGPFKLAEWTQGERLVLVRNDNYHGQKPILDRVEYRLLSGIPINMYELDEIDATGISVSYIDRVEDENGPFAGQLQVTPELSFSYLGFNTGEPPFDDVHVRRAFTHALDKAKIVRLMYRDMVEVARGILPPGVPGYNENLAGLEFDLELARQEMALSRYGSAAALPPITLTVAGYGGNIGSYIEAVVVQWQEHLGVDITVRQLEPEYYFYNLPEEKDEIFEMGWVADYPHPQDFLEVLFRTGQENNFAGYSNPAVDALLDEAASAEDGALELYRQAEELLVEDAACLPLWFGQNYMLVKPWVRDFKLNPMGLPELGLVWIDRE